MKSRSFLFATLLFVVSFFLYSCDDDDDSESKLPVTADVTYYIANGYTLLEMVNINVEYTGQDGKIVKEQVTVTPWDKKLKKVSVPFPAKMKVTYTRKEGFVATETSYRIGEGVSIGYVTTDEQMEGGSSNVSLTISKDKIDTFIELLISKPVEVSREIVANE